MQQHLGRIVGPGAGDRRRLGARVAHHDRAAEPRAHLLGQLGRDRRGAGRAEPQRREVGVGELREIDELRPLRRHAPAHGGVLGDHLLEHRLRGPRRGGEHAVDDELDLVPELVHVARVRERHRHQPHVVVRAEDVAQPRRRLQRAVVEPRALRQAGGAARPHDAHRILGRADRSVGERRARLPRRRDLGARHEHRGHGGIGGDRGVGALVEQRDRARSGGGSPTPRRGRAAVLMPVATAPRRVHAAYATA